MKMEFLAEGSEDCPLIRLYEFQPSEASKLGSLFESLAEGTRESIALHEQDFVEPVSGCQLNLLLGSRDRGINETEGMAFQCVASKQSWLEMSAMTQPFGTELERGHYQWLNEDGAVSLLLSKNGQW